MATVNPQTPVCPQPSPVSTQSAQEFPSSDITFRELEGRGDPHYSYISGIPKRPCDTDGIEIVRREETGEASTSKSTTFPSSSLTFQVLMCKAYECGYAVEKLRGLEKSVTIWNMFNEEDENIARFEKEFTWNPTFSEFRVYLKDYRGGNLDNLLIKVQNKKHHRGQHPDDHHLFPTMALRIALDIAKGVRSCHRHNIVHGDLQPHNILLGNAWKCNNLCWSAWRGGWLHDGHEKEYDDLEHLLQRGWRTSAVVCGFERSTIIGSPENHSAPGTLAITKPGSKENDIYNLGQLIYTVLSGRWPPIRHTPYGCTERLIHILRRCVRTDPMQRPEIDEIIKVLDDALLKQLRDFDESDVIRYARANLPSFQRSEPRPTARQSSHDSLPPQPRAQWRSDFFGGPLSPSYHSDSEGESP